MNKLTFRTAVLVLLILCSASILLISMLPGNAVNAMQSGQAASTPTATPTVAAPSGPGLYLFMEVPSGEVSTPYVILSSFREPPSTAPVIIKGVINESFEFTCNASPCNLPLASDSILRFQAFSEDQVSAEYTATVRVVQPSAGVYKVTLEAFAPEQTLPSDSCSAIWGVPRSITADWAIMMKKPEQLNTNVTLHYLASRLIEHGIVDVSDCPGGGTINGAPNACGIEKSRAAMIEWQNKFDFDIWMASKTVGIPPRMLKALILQETQFWPENASFFVEEYGLAQINEMGADVALRWNLNLYQDICRQVLTNCPGPYLTLSTSLSQMVRGTLLRQLNSECPTCQYGLDLQVAHNSIQTIARVLNANCSESDFLLIQNSIDPKKMEYDDLWKVTIASYHSGYGCVDDALKITHTKGETPDWAHISSHLQCEGAVAYVDRFWSTLNNLDAYAIQVEPNEVADVSVIALPTIAPYPTPAFSSASVRVRVYVDANANNTADPGEGVKSATVKVTFTNGTSLTANTDDQGLVVFDMTGKKIGETVTVSLVSLYRSQTVSIPETGVMDIVFRFSQPNLPSHVP